MARIDRLDVMTGQVTPLCSVPIPNSGWPFGDVVGGLDMRFDGTLLFQSGLTTLVFLDPSSCRVTLVPTMMPIGLHTTDGAVAFGEPVPALAQRHGFHVESEPGAGCDAPLIGGLTVHLVVPVRTQVDGRTPAIARAGRPSEERGGTTEPARTRTQSEIRPRFSTAVIGML